MAAEDAVRVDPPAMRGFADALSGRAEELRNQFAQLNAAVGDMLGGWRGTSGIAYASAWELWHRGAGEVELGLSMLTRLVGRAAELYQENEATSAHALRGVRRG